MKLTAFSIYAQKPPPIVLPSSCLTCILNTTEDSKIHINPIPKSLGNPNELNFKYTQPARGTLTGNISDLLYTPNKGFVGDDSFILKLANKSNPANTSTIEVKVAVSSDNFHFIYISDPKLRILLAFSIAAASVFAIYLVADFIIRGFNPRTELKLKTFDTQKEPPKYESRFSDIIRSGDMEPSLSIFQFLIWTFVITFAFIGVYFTRLFAGIPNLPEGSIPYNLILLMGISAGTPILSSIITTYKYGTEILPHGERPEYAKVEPQGDISKRSQGDNFKRPPLSDMLKENGKANLSRFQMFAWTWMGVAVYLSVVFSTVNEMSNQLQNLTLPDIDTTLVALMGLSQATFLGVKAANKTIEISAIYPLEVEAGQFISIFGANFGKKDTVWIGKRRIWRGDEEDEGLIWEDERIDLRIPQDLPPGEYEVKVVKGGERAIAKEKLTVQLSKSDYKSTVENERENQHAHANPGPSTKSPEHLIMEARDHYKDGRYKMAIGIINELLASNPKNVEALNEKGKSLDALDKHDEAILSYKKAVSIDPKYLFGWYNGALSYQYIDKSEAVRWLDRAIKLDPLNSDAWHNRGKLLESLGNTEQARESYEKSKALKGQYK